MQCVGVCYQPAAYLSYRQTRWLCVLAACQQLHNAGLMGADTVTEAVAVCISGLMSVTLQTVVL